MRSSSEGWEGLEDFRGEIETSKDPEPEPTLEGESRLELELEVEDTVASLADIDEGCDCFASAIVAELTLLDTLSSKGLSAEAGDPKCCGERRSGRERSWFWGVGGWKMGESSSATWASSLLLPGGDR